MRPFPMRLATRLACVASLIAGSPLLAQVSSAVLSAEERTAVRTVDTENARTLALLQRIVDINSGTMNFAGVRRVAAVLRAELGALRFPPSWVDRRSSH